LKADSVLTSLKPARLYLNHSEKLGTNRVI
jgi:hypothetical protein